MSSSNIVPMADYIRDDLQMYPRVEDPKTKHDDRYDSSKYISVQTRVNNDPKFADKYYSKIANDGWVTLQDVEQIFGLRKGNAFKYTLNGDSLSGAPEGTFRSGGWYVGKNLDDPDNNHKYILYKGYNGAIFSLQLKDLKEVFVKMGKKSRPVFKRPGNPTNFPVYLKEESTGRDVVVYYGKDEFNRKKFMNSMKFKTAVAYGRWSWSAVNFNK